MFWGHDLSWWSFTLGIVFFALAIPLAIVGNLLTPKVRAWWLVRSLDSKAKKLGGLKNAIANLDTSPELSYSATQILRGMLALTWFLIISLDLGFIATLVAIGALGSGQHTHLRANFMFLANLAVDAVTISGFYARWRIQRLLLTSREEKLRMRAAFEKEKQELEQLVDITEKQKQSGAI